MFVNVLYLLGNWRFIYIVSAAVFNTASSEVKRQVPCSCTHVTIFSHVRHVQINMIIQILHDCVTYFHFQVQSQTFSTHQLYTHPMTLPLHALSISALLQPVLELQELSGRLKKLRWSLSSVAATMHHGEVGPPMEAINQHLSEVITFYETLLNQSKIDLRNALREYVNRSWQLPPLDGPQCSSTWSVLPVFCLRSN